MNIRSTTDSDKPISPQPRPVPESSDLKITAIETLLPHDIMPGLMLLRIHTDKGLIGHGETYYIPHAAAAVIHDWMARRLIGSDPLSIEHHWRFFYERTSAFGSRGSELRAISAIDLALWDILGKETGLPVHTLMSRLATSGWQSEGSCPRLQQLRRPYLRASSARRNPGSRLAGTW